jgi:hypothetical protein
VTAGTAGAAGCGPAAMGGAAVVGVTAGTAGAAGCGPAAMGGAAVGVTAGTAGAAVGVTAGAGAAGGAAAGCGPAADRARSAPSRLPMPSSALEISLGTIHTLFASPCAICGSICMYW